MFAQQIQKFLFVGEFPVMLLLIANVFRDSGNL